MLKALTAVYPVSFMPTGGVSPSNVKNYLAIPAVLACGGTWMVPNDLIDNEKWDELAVLVKEVAGIIA
jgi:2-dehydro-3-deoxyphosphogluconate aldolase/(4S)-4-hydroxy-2-oxoglutarate aldolase